MRSTGTYARAPRRFPTSRNWLGTGPAHLRLRPRLWLLRSHIISSTTSRIRMRTPSTTIISTSTTISHRCSITPPSTARFRQRRSRTLVLLASTSTLTTRLSGRRPCIIITHKIADCNFRLSALTLLYNWVHYGTHSQTFPYVHVYVFHDDSLSCPSSIPVYMPKYFRASIRTLVVVLLSHLSSHCRSCSHAHIRRTTTPCIQPRIHSSIPSLIFESQLPSSRNHHFHP